jgi:broad specificity phosphatase PhoE
MKFVFIRHGHRDTSDRLKDNGLSDKGLEQSRRLAAYFKTRFVSDRGKDAETRLALFSSPKKRCIETLGPIAKLLGAKIAISDLLVEQTGLETESAFKKRIGKFLREDHGCETAIVCSHGDWIPYAIELLSGASVDVKKASWVEIENGSLLRLIQPDDY